MSKVCHFCGNKHFKHTTVQYTYRHDDKFLFVNDGKKIKTEIRVPVEPFLELIHA